MLSKSKRMKSPLEIAVAVKKGAGKKPPGMDGGQGAGDDGDDGDDQFGPDGDEDSGLHSLFGGDDDGGDAGDATGAPHLTPHEMENTSLADATPEQLQAALAAKKPARGDDGDEGGGGDDGSTQGGDDDAGDGDYV